MDFVAAGPDGDVGTGAAIDVRDISENEATFIGEYLKVKKVAVLNGSDEYSQTLADTVIKLIKERYGVEILTQQKYNPGDTDFSSQWLAVKQANPEYILMFGLYLADSDGTMKATFAYIFWGETICIIAFGISWITKGNWFIFGDGTEE